MTKYKGVDLFKSAKDTMKVGVASMVGSSVIGSIPGGNPMLKNTINSSLNLVNVGQYGKVGMDLIKSLKK